jgi:putative ABC transport system substrate-binding protein
MRRREFITLLGGAAAWPVTTRAQQKSPAMIGWLGSGSPESSGAPEAFHRGLVTQGYIEGVNLTVEYRWARDHYDSLPALVKDLLDHQVSVIAAAGGPVSALAAKSLTATVPIVFTAVSDPVKMGLVASLNHPGGNVTGIAALTRELDPKRLELLREILPFAATLGALVNPNRPDLDAQLTDLLQAARSMGVNLVVIRAGSERELDAVVDEARQQDIQALLIAADPFFNSRRKQLLALLSRASIPMIFPWREFTVGGGLMSYGPSLADAYREAGVYVGRILSGQAPSDLPVLQPTKFELVINLKTATALGLTFLPTLLARADEVIE